MGDFEYYLTLGLQHILDIKGYDHILFIVILCSAYEVTQWRKIFVLVTAFTLGHSITLALAVLNIVSFSSSTIELLIPITILCTCIFNLFKVSKENYKTKISYLTTLSFGLIHGLGFSNYLRSILTGLADITAPLFYFNIGLEIGQIQIVLQFIGIVYILLSMGLKFIHLKYTINIIGILIVTPMIIERL